MASLSEVVGQTQRAFYCEVDLHAKEMYACVVDQQGNKQLHKNFQTHHPKNSSSEIKHLDQISSSAVNPLSTGTGCAMPARYLLHMGTHCICKPFTAVKPKAKQPRSSPQIVWRFSPQLGL